MNLIVIGCGRVGSELAYRLFQKGHKVTVIDQDDHAFNNSPDDFLGRMVEGEALNKDVLLHAGIETADGVAIVTSSDTLIAVIGHTIRSVFKITNLVVRNFDPSWRLMFDVTISAFPIIDAFVWSLGSSTNTLTVGFFLISLILLVLNPVANQMTISLPRGRLVIILPWGAPSVPKVMRFEYLLRLINADYLLLYIILGHNNLLFDLYEVIFLF